MKPDLQSQPVGAESELVNPPKERVLAVVVTYNSADVLPGLLPTLVSGFGHIDWQLVVADNDSVDGSVDLVTAEVPLARIVQLGRNAGYAAAINAAVKTADAFTAVLVLNPDVRLSAGCVAELLSAVRQPGTGIAVPRLLDAKGELIESMRREPSLMRAWADALVGASRAGLFPRFGEMVTDRKRYDEECVTDWAEGSVQLISSECWSSCGPWDESFFLYSEETEYDLRARDAGYTTRFVPSAVAVHLEGGSAQSPGLWRLLVLNRVRLYRRRNGRLKAAGFWLAVLVREAIRALLGRATGRAAVKGLLSRRRWTEPAGPSAVQT